jgi:polar amino acid transport system ATP-binding protein
MCRSRHPPHLRQDGHGLPALQPVPAHDRAAERHRGADDRQGHAREEIIPKAEALLLKKVGLLDKRDSYPSRLSGGQKQRVAIARALAMEPDIMLFDEPTSALDPELTGEVLRTMRELAEEHMTMLVVTHEMAFAREVASRVVFMDGGEILESRPSRELFAAPEHPRTRAFLENML